MSKYQTSDEVANTVHVSVPFQVPRDPEQYRKGDHFNDRLEERVPKELQGRIVDTLIQSGHCEATGPVSIPDQRHEFVQCFKFSRSFGGTTWSLVVGIRRSAFVHDRWRHKIKTIIKE